MTDCIPGKTRRKTRSAPSRRRSPLSSLISFSIVLLFAAPPPLPPQSAHVSLTARPRPYIVYMLQDLDILEDWTAIRKVIYIWAVVNKSQKRRSRCVTRRSVLSPLRRWRLSGRIGGRPTVRTAQGHFLYCVLWSPLVYPCVPLSPPPSQNGTTPPRRTVRRRTTFLWQPVVLQGASHLYQQEGRVSHQVCLRKGGLFGNFPILWVAWY